MKTNWTKKQLREFVLDQLYNIAGSFLYAAGVCYFAKNAPFAPGGVSGLALIIHHLTGLPIGLTTLVLNVPLILVSYRFLGRDFLRRTLVSMAWLTVFQDVVFPLLPAYRGEPVLASLFTGVLWGAGLALFYMRGSSSGGTDFLTLSIKVLRPHLSVGGVTGTIDVVIILIGWAVYGSVDAALYGLMTTVVTSVMIDKMLYGSSASKMVMIITNRGQELAQYISDTCGRGSTMMQATGTYTGARRQILLCACARQEAYKIRSGAYGIDPKCMVMISDTSEVYGEGFLDHAGQNFV